MILSIVLFTTFNIKTENEPPGTFYINFHHLVQSKINKFTLQSTENRFKHYANKRNEISLTC